MNWRNPKVILPLQNQKVWVMLKPHKDRGSLLKSAASIQIVCGEFSWANDFSSCRVENYDELGHGSISWYLIPPEDFRYDESLGVAWLPVEEMILPNWEMNV